MSNRPGVSDWWWSANRLGSRGRGRGRRGMCVCAGPAVWLWPVVGLGLCWGLLSAPRAFGQVDPFAHPLGFNQPTLLTAEPGLQAATMQPVTDDRGLEWRVDASGQALTVAHDSSLGEPARQLLGLSINGQAFQCRSPLQTLDGREWVLRHEVAGADFQVERRIQVVRPDGVIRYLERVENLTAAPLTVRLEWSVHFAQTIEKMVTVGGEGPTSIRPGDGPLWVVPSGGRHHSWLFAMVGGMAPSGIEFEVGQQTGRGVLSLAHEMVLPVGGKASVLLGAAPVRQSTEAESHVALDREVNRVQLALEFNRLVTLVPEWWREGLVNVHPVVAGPAASWQAREQAWLGLREEFRDVLTLGAGGRLRGEASWDRLTVEPRFGRVDLQRDQVAAVYGDRAGAGGGGMVRLKDGQWLRGRLQGEGFEFRMGSSVAMSLDPADLELLVLAADEAGHALEQADAGGGEQNGEAGADAAVNDEAGAEAGEQRPPQAPPRADVGGAGRELGLVRLSDGGSLAYSAVEGGELGFHTSYGAVRAALPELVWMQRGAGGSPLWYFQFGNGTRLLGVPEPGLLRFATPLFAAGLEVRSTEIEGMMGGAMWAALRDADLEAAEVALAGLEQFVPAGHSVLELTGAQRVVGRIKLPALELSSPLGTVTLDTAMVRRVTREPAQRLSPLEFPPRFRIELWDGDVVSGPLLDRRLQVQVDDNLLVVPMAELLEWTNISPTVTDDLAARITELIFQLGADEWAARERASRELAELGGPAGSLLRQALAEAQDPEVRRRLQDLIDELP